MRLAKVTFAGNRATTIDALPARVVHRIARHEDDAEILMRLFQLGIVTLFGTLYAISPKTDIETSFALAPYAIGIYFAATLFGLAWSIRSRIPDWAAYGSILLDIGLLVVMIWSFHLQYEQPAAFYLKAPTILYMFIFIALRALRFRARFVVVTGVAATLGWVALFVYAIAADPTDTTVTRDYVAYMTSNAVLIGAEIDKIVSILTVTAVLAIVIRRTRRILVQAVVEEGAARDLSRFFDASVAQHIRGAGHDVAAGEGVLRQAAVLFVDIRGFSGYAAGLAPNDAMRMLSEYQARLVPLIQSCGGTIDKFLGDGIMATFGAVDPTGTYAADALRAVDAVMRETSAWPGSGALGAISVNASVTCGQVIFGAVGGVERLEYTVIGAPVNLAAKLEKLNKSLASRAICAADAFETARAQGYLPAGSPRRQSVTLEGGDTVEVIVLN